MRRYGLGLALVLLLPVAAQAVRLVYRLRVGSTWQYTEKMSASGALTMSSPLGDQAIPISMKVTEERSLKVTEDAGNGQYWLESRSLSTDATVTVQGQTQRQDVPGQNLKLKVTALGDVLETRQLATTQRGDVKLDLKLDSLLKASRMVGFPSEDLSVGARWEKEIPMRLQDGTTVTAKVSTQLKALDGGIATLATRYQVPIPASDGTMSMGGMEIPVKVEGHSTGQTTAHWDVANGCLKDSAGTGKIELKLYLMGLTTDPAIAKFDVDTNVTLHQP